MDGHELFKPLFREGRLRPCASVDTADRQPLGPFSLDTSDRRSISTSGLRPSFELAVLSGYGVVFANRRNGGVVCLGDGFFFASLVLLRLPFHIIAMPDCGAHSAYLALLASLPISVHVRKFNLLMLHCRKHRFPSYVDAPHQEGSILDGDARDYDVSI